MEMLENGRKRTLPKKQFHKEMLEKKERKYSDRYNDIHGWNEGGTGELEELEYNEYGDVQNAVGEEEKAEMEKKMQEQHQSPNIVIVKAAEEQEEVEVEERQDVTPEETIREMQATTVVTTKAKIEIETS